METILKLGYYGNTDYGKRVYWINPQDKNNTFDFVWKKEVGEFIEKELSEGRSVKVIL